VTVTHREEVKHLHRDQRFDDHRPRLIEARALGLRQRELHENSLCEQGKNREETPQDEAIQ
jgi:hypothetical protein